MNITKLENNVLSEQQQSEKQREILTDEQNNFQAELNLLLAQNNISLNSTDTNILINSFNNTSKTINSSKILNWASELYETKSAFNYNTMTMDRDDAIFFANLTQNIPAQVSINNNEITLNVLNEVEEIQKPLNASKTLINIIENCYKTQQSARLDFDNNISVILKIDKAGKVSAEFIPSDKIAEQYLKNNIAFLKQTFDEENLPYTELSYREQNKNRNNRNKDKKDE
ncbi:hypothetical protein J6Q66_02745 [bacterium]|nr:hypothetical protein [bacterium]